MDASTTRSFAINPGTIKLPLNAQRTGEVTVTVTNQSGAFKKGFVRCQPQGAAAPDPKRPDILIDGEKERPFEKGAAQQFKVKVSAKPDVKDGTYQFRLDVANSADPEGDWTEGPVIEITVPKVGVAPPPPPGPKWWIFLLIGAGVLLIGGVVLFFVLHHSGGIEVPNLVGMTFEDAEKAAEGAGLKVEPAEEKKDDSKKEDAKKDDSKKEESKKDDKKDEHHEAKDSKKDEKKSSGKEEPPDAKTDKKEESSGDKPRDPKILKSKVESQDPAAGEKVSADTVISVVLETGKTPPEDGGQKPAEISIPSAIGLTIEQAKLRLYDAGFTPVVAAPEFKGSTPGTIVEQKPAANSKGEKGSEVTLFPEKENVAVPNLVGKPVKDAIFDLNHLKLIGNIVYQSTPGSATDHVIDQNPKPNTRVELDSTVTVTVPHGYVLPVVPKEQLRTLQPATARLFAVMNSVTGITVSPGSPAYLRKTGLTVSFHYVTSSGEKAKLRVTAMVGGKQVPGSTEPVLSGSAPGSGDLRAVLSFKSPTAIDTIRVTLLGPDGKTLDEEHLAVKFTVTPF